MNNRKLIGKILSIAALLIFINSASADVVSECSDQLSALQTQASDKKNECDGLRAQLGSKSGAYLACKSQLAAIKTQISSKKRECKTIKATCKANAKNVKTTKKQYDKEVKAEAKIIKRRDKEIDKKSRQLAVYQSKMDIIQQRKSFAEAQSGITCVLGLLGGNEQACQGFLRDIQKYELQQGALRDKREAYIAKQDNKISRLQNDLATQQGKITAALAKYDAALNKNSTAMCPAV